MSKSTILAIAGAAILVIALLTSIGVNSPEAATAAPPAAVVTPAASPNLTSGNARIAPFFDARALTADTRVCFDMPDYELLDVQYVIDQNAAATNTIALSLQHSNNNLTYEAGVSLVTGNSTDANALTQRAIFGRWTCAFADVTNSNPVTVTVIGVGK